jgi:hypothetical protein
MTAPDVEEKKLWTADKPYPQWPFGTVNPEELAKWDAINNPVEEALI